MLTIPRGSRDNLMANVEINQEIHAPLQKGQQLGSLTIAGGTSLSTPLVALNAVEEAGFFSRLWDTLSLFFLKMFSGDPLALEA